MDHWSQIADRKWELKFNETILATIYEKPINNKFSVYFSVPKIFAKLTMESFTTHQFASLEEAKEQCVNLYHEKAEQWAKDLLAFLESPQRYNKQ